MIEVYAVNINENLEKVLADELALFLSDEKQKRVSRFYRFEDAQRTLIGDILVRILICNSLKIKNREIVFNKNEYGKPSLQNNNNFCFNISHAGNWVVCATHGTSVGIDVEHISPINLNIAKRYFSNEEYNNLMDRDESQRLSYFYDLWTLKESYIKAVGKGLSLPLDSFTMNIDGDKATVISQNESSDYYFKLYSIDQSYKMAVCSRENKFPESIKIYKTKDLYKEAWVLRDICIN